MKPTEVGIWHTARSRLLAKLIRRNGWTIGAELGVEAGHTHLSLLARCRILTLIGVDNWTGTYRGKPRSAMYDELVQVTESLGDRSRLIRADTVDAADQIADGSLNFVFIDANHSKASVRADIEAWAPKLEAHGWLTGHDYDLPGVQKAIRGLLPGHTLHSEVSKVWSIPIAETRYAL